MANSLEIRHDGETILKQIKPATDFSSRLHGLMFYRVFPDMGGMLFHPCRSVHTFWMRFPLDLIMMDTHGRITRVLENIPPNRIAGGPRETVYVLEIPAGTVAKWCLHAGDVLKWDGI